MPEHGFYTHHTVEVGPGGVRLRTPEPPLELEPSARGQTPLALAVEHPRAAGVAFGLTGAGLLGAPTVMVFALGLPAWLLVGPLLLATGAFVAAIAVWRGALARFARARRRPQLERRLLELAEHMRGSLTVPLVARHLSVSMPEADELLTSLARAGYVELEIDPDTGAVLYLFPSLETKHLR